MLQWLMIIAVFLLANSVASGRLFLIQKWLRAQGATTQIFKAKQCVIREHDGHRL